MNLTYGEYKIFNDGNGWYVAQYVKSMSGKYGLWQQISKLYQYQKCALKLMCKLVYQQQLNGQI